MDPPERTGARERATPVRQIARGAARNRPRLGVNPATKVLVGRQQRSAAELQQGAERPTRPPAPRRDGL